MILLLMHLSSTKKNLKIKKKNESKNILFYVKIIIINKKKFTNITKIKALFFNLSFI